LKKVLYLSYDGMTDPLGQGQVLSYLTGLAAKGHVITLVSFEKADRYAKDRETIEGICKNAGIDWRPLPYTKTPPVLSTIYDLRKLRNVARKLHREKKFDIVHCRGYLPALSGLYLKRKYGVRFIFDMRGFWIDEKSEGAGGWNPSSPIYSRVIAYLRKQEKAFYLESDDIITLTHAAKRVIAEEYPALEKKITVIPTCVNLDLFTSFQSKERNSVRDKFGIPHNAFVLLYSGGTGPNYDIGFLLRAYDHLKTIHQNPWLLVLTKDGISGLEAAGLTDATYVRTVSVPYREVSHHLMAGDLGVVNYATGMSVAGRSPTKLGEYWSAGLPAISPAGVGDVDELFSKYANSGLIIKDLDFSRLKADSFAQSDPLVLRQYANEYFGLEKGTASYNNLYEGK
jgi:glycosyltransferase involved in cell wall biosynthesis